MGRKIAAVFIILCMSIAATPAFAQMVCGKHDVIEKKLEDDYKEVRIGSGLTGTDEQPAHKRRIVSLYLSEEGTFSVVITNTTGTTCLMAVGENWETVKEPTPIKEGDLL